MKRCGMCIYWGDHRGVSIETYAHCLHPITQVMHTVEQAKCLPSAVTTLKIQAMFAYEGTDCPTYEVQP